MPASDEEIWVYFGDDGQEIRLSYLSFALYSFDKIEFVRKYRQLHGIDPAPEQVSDWIAHLPNSRLDEIQRLARTFFDSAARAYLGDEHARAIHEAVNGEIVRAIKDSNAAVANRVERATSFRSTWVPGVFIGIVSSFVFSLILLMAYLVVTRDPSPIDLAKRYRSVLGTASATSGKSQTVSAPSTTH